MVRLAVSSHINLADTALGSSVQPIVGKGTSRSWKWQITPEQPGPASLLITATTYEGQSQTVLSQEYIAIKMTVGTTTAFASAHDARTRNQYLHAGKAFVDTTAGLITAVGGAVAVVAGGLSWFQLQRTRRRKARTEAAKMNKKRRKRQPTPSPDSKSQLI